MSDTTRISNVFSTKTNYGLIHRHVDWFVATQSLLHFEWIASGKLRTASTDKIVCTSASTKTFDISI